MIIYLAINKINGKRYVGQTIEGLNRRISKHLCSGHGAFPSALKKYGLQSFDFSIIDIATSREELSEKEVYWILFHNCKTPNGYNLTDGGESTLGYTHSEEEIKKMSESHIGKIPWNKGKTGIYSEETLQKNSKAHKGKPRSEETKRKMSEATKGKPHQKQNKIIKE